MNIRFITTICFVLMLVLVSGCTHKDGGEYGGGDQDGMSAEHGAKNEDEVARQLITGEGSADGGKIEGVHADVPYEFYIANPMTNSPSLSKVVEKESGDDVTASAVPEEMTFFIWKESKSMWVSPTGEYVAFYSIEDDGTYFVAVYDLATFERKDVFTIPNDQSVVSHYTSDNTVIELPDTFWTSDTTFQIGVYPMPSPLEIPTEKRDTLKVVTLEV